MPTTVVFDVGNVLIRWDPRILYAQIFPDPDEMAWFMTNVVTAAWNLELDRGRSYADSIAELVDRHPEWENEIRAYDLRWHEMVPGEIVENVTVLETLRQRGVPNYAITNYSREKWAESLVRFPFLGGFQDAVVSGHERVVKPDSAIYRILLERNGLAARDCVFIDDNAANIEAARQLGFSVIHYGPDVQLSPRLADLGIDVGA